MDQKPTISEIDNALAHAVSLVRAWAASMVVEGEDDHVVRGIELARRIEENRSFAKLLVSEKTSCPSHKVAKQEMDAAKPKNKIFGASNNQNNNRSNRRSAEFPIFFIDSGKLIKIGKTRSEDPKKSLYKKTMPMEDAIALMDLLAEFLSQNKGRLVARDYISYIAHSGMIVPEYRVHLLIGALEKIDSLVAAGKGFYQSTDAHPMPRMWLDRLEKLDKGGDIIG